MYVWQCAHRHYDEFGEAYPEAYQPRYGILRPIIPEVVHKFLECGNLERGFARIRCDHCEHEYLLAFSCKSRWFCPSCHQKNVQNTARFILDQVVAPVPHRHYVLAIPKMLRPYFQRHRHLLKRLCTLAHESLTAWGNTAASTSTPTTASRLRREAEINSEGGMARPAFAQKLRRTRRRTSRRAGGATAREANGGGGLRWGWM
jgi:hypothetical protein